MSEGITIQINVPEGIERLIPRVADFFDNYDSSPTTASNPDEIMTADDVCSVFKLNKTKLYTLTMKTGPGTIPRFKIGRDLRFKRSELTKWFDSQRIR